MDKWLNVIFNELEVVKLAIVLSERPDILDQVKAALNENPTN